MKVSVTLAMALLGVATVSAFTVVGSRQHAASLSRTRGGADHTPGASPTTLHMAAPADFIKSEIASNEVRQTTCCAFSVKSSRRGQNRLTF
jgi:hypothetical protein